MRHKFMTQTSFGRVAAVLTAIWSVAVPTLALAQGPATSAAPPALSRVEETELLERRKAAEFERLRAQVLDSSLDRGTRAVALYEIAQLGTRSAAEFLESVYDRPLNVTDHEDLRIIDASGEFGGEHSVPLLLKAMQHYLKGVPAWGDIRWRAAEALFRIQGPESLPEIEKLLLDPDITVRRTVERILKASREGMSEAESQSVTKTIVAWARSAKADRYLKDEVVYLLKIHERPRSIDDDSIRLYSERELQLLDKYWDSYNIYIITSNGERIDARIASTEALAMEGHVFPFSGWRLELNKVDGDWLVTKAVPNK